MLTNASRGTLYLLLHAAYRAIDHARAVEHAHRPLDFDREVDVAGGVDDVDPVLGEVLVHPLPEAGRRRGRDGDAALALLLHPVHDRGAVVHFADLVRDAGVEKDAFGGRGLACVYVRTDADVPVTINWCNSRHIFGRSGNEELLLIAREIRLKRFFVGLRI